MSDDGDMGMGHAGYALGLVAVNGLLGAGSCICLLANMNTAQKGNLETKVENIQLITKNVIGGSEPEKFYKVNDQRVYLEIDGKPVEEYWRGK